MRDTIRAEKLLSLFTSPDRAAAIAGDLTEERSHRGPLSFWLEVARTLFGLWRGAMTDAPLRVAMLAVSGCTLLIGPVLLGIAAVGLFPASIGWPGSWIALSFFWSAGALWTGISLVSIAQSDGMAACAALAVIGETVLIAFVARARLPDLPTIQLVLVYTTGLVAPGLLLIGGAIARRRMIVADVPTLEEPR